MAPHAEEPAIEAVTDTQSTMIPDPILHKSPTQLHKTPRPQRFGINDVLPYRQSCQPLSKGVASFSSATMFKSTLSKSRKTKSKDWSERFSAESKARKASSLKGAMKHFREGTISLCGGLPSTDYFPFEELSVKVPRSLSSGMFSAMPEEEDLVTLGAGKYDVAEGKSAYDLAIALNYGQSMGPPQLMRFVTEHTEIVHDPQYSDWEICLTAGSTSALDIALRLFAERGHALLTEEYSFSSAIETALPMGIKPIGIKMDEDGMLATDLDHVLSNWNEKERGAPKPFLVYTVPTGQNPTSSTQPIERRKAIYAVAEKHDLFILEDEPYYFLQMDPYISPKSQPEVSAEDTEPMPLNSFLQSLTPSYLSLDTTGRVLRMDSFSKIVAPGSRTGWVTGPPQVIERFIRHSEVSAQTPSGFAMMSLYKLLDEEWGHEGFLRWLMHLRNEYGRRRNVIVGACEEYLPAASGVCSWTPPRAGMFHWIKTDVSKHPLWRAELNKNKGYISDERKQELVAEIEEKIFLSGVNHSVLVARGSWFRAEKGNVKLIVSASSMNGHAESYTNGHEEEPNGTDADTPDLFFRMTFAAAAEDKMAEAVKRFGDALREEFELELEA